MYRNGGNQGEQVQTTHKDAVINSLKKQLLEMKDLEHQFIRLNDEVSNIQARYGMLLDEKQRTENQYKIKMERNKKDISQLRGIVDNLKIQIHKAQVQIEDTVRENSTLKRMCDNRENEISSLLISNNQIEKNNQIQNQQNKNIANKLKQLKEERNKNQNQCQRLNKLLEQNINHLKKLQKQARNLQSLNIKNQNLLVQAERDRLDLTEQMKSREDAVTSTNKKVQQLDDEIAEIKQRTNKVQRDCIKSQAQYKSVSENLQGSIAKNKDLSNKLKGLQNTLRITQHQLDQATINRQSLRKVHADLIIQNKDVNQELDKTLLIIMDYQGINFELQKQVQNYIECDQEARQLLNRKEAMKNLLNQVTTKLQKTNKQISHLR